MSVPSAMTDPVFSRLLRETAALLEPLPAHVALVSGVADRLADSLCLEPFEGLHFERSVRFGSLSRHTALSPLNDDDRILLFRPDRRRGADPPSLSPRSFLEAIEARVTALLEDLEEHATVLIRPQQHSVGLRFVHQQTPDCASLELRIDLVPVLVRASGEIVRLPERDTDSWLPASPHRMRDRLALLSERQPWVRPAIRLLKGWKRLEELPLPGYALELLVSRYALRHRGIAAPGSLVAAVLENIEARAVFFTLVTQDSPVPLLDPWTRRDVLARPGPPEWARIAPACRDALAKLEAAAVATREGDLTHARIRLGETFVGRAPLHQARRIRHALPPCSPWFSEDP